MEKSHRNTLARIKLLMGATFNETNRPTLYPDCQSDSTVRQWCKRAICRRIRGTFKAHEEVVKELDRAAAIINSDTGVSVSVSPGISVRRRVRGVLQYAVMQPFSVEIYRIIEGSGTLVTGELLNLPVANSIGDDTVRIEGGTARQIKAGDMLVLQPGTPTGLARSMASRSPI